MKWLQQGANTFSKFKWRQSTSRYFHMFFLLIFKLVDVMVEQYRNLPVDKDADPNVVPVTAPLLARMQIVGEGGEQHTIDVSGLTPEQALEILERVSSSPSASAREEDDVDGDGYSYRNDYISFGDSRVVFLPKVKRVSEVWFWVYVMDPRLSCGQALKDVLDMNEEYARSISERVARLASMSVEKVSDNVKDHNRYQLINHSMWLFIVDLIYNQSVLTAPQSERFLMNNAVTLASEMHLAHPIRWFGAVEVFRRMQYDPDALASVPEALRDIENYSYTTYLSSLSVVPPGYEQRAQDILNGAPDMLVTVWTFPQPSNVVALPLRTCKPEIMHYKVLPHHQKRQQQYFASVLEDLTQQTTALSLSELGHDNDLDNDLHDDEEQVDAHWARVYRETRQPEIREYMLNDEAMTTQFAVTQLDEWDNQHFKTAQETRLEAQAMMSDMRQIRHMHLKEWKRLQEVAAAGDQLQYNALYREYQREAFETFRDSGWTPDAQNSATLRKIIEFSQGPQMQQFRSTVWELTDHGKSLFDNMTISILDRFERLLLVANTHLQLMYVLMTVYDALREVFALHLNMVLVGDGNTGKSYKMQLAQLLSVVGTIVSEGYQTAKAYAVDGNHNDECVFQEEAHMKMFVESKTEPSEQVALTKSRLTSCIMRARTLVIGPDGQREQRITYAECISTLVMASNDMMTGIGEALKSRISFHVCPNTNVRNLTMLMQYENQMGERQKAEREQFVREMQFFHLCHAVIEKMLTAKVLSPVNTDVSFLFWNRFISECKNVGIYVHPRTFKRGIIMAGRLTTQYAIYQLYFVPGAPYLGQPFDLEQLLDADPLLRDDEDIAIQSIGMHTHEFMSEEKDRVLEILRTLNEEQEMTSASRTGAQNIRRGSATEHSEGMSAGFSATTANATGLYVNPTTGATGTRVQSIVRELQRVGEERRQQQQAQPPALANANVAPWQRQGVSAGAGGGNAFQSALMRRSDPNFVSAGCDMNQLASRVHNTMSASHRLSIRQILTFLEEMREETVKAMPYRFIDGSVTQVELDLNAPSMQTYEKLKIVESRVYLHRSLFDAHDDSVGAAATKGGVQRMDRLFMKLLGRTAQHRYSIERSMLVGRQLSTYLPHLIRCWNIKATDAFMRIETPIFEGQEIRQSIERAYGKARVRQMVRREEAEDDDDGVDFNDNDNDVDSSSDDEDDDDDDGLTHFTVISEDLGTYAARRRLLQVGIVPTEEAVASHHWMPRLLNAVRAQMEMGLMTQSITYPEVFEEKSAAFRRKRDAILAKIQKSTSNSSNGHIRGVQWSNEAHLALFRSNPEALKNPVQAPNTQLMQSLTRKRKEVATGATTTSTTTTSSSNSAAVAFSAETTRALLEQMTGQSYPAPVVRTARGGGGKKKKLI